MSLIIYDNVCKDCGYHNFSKEKAKICHNCGGTDFNYRPKGDE